MPQDLLSPRGLTITELAVLGMLGYVDRPISGYDLHKLIGISVGFIWQPSKTQLYAVLPRLLDAGLARRREAVEWAEAALQELTR